MNKGQKVLAGLLALVAVELLPVSVVSTRVLAGELESELGKARNAAMHDMNEED